MATSQTRRPLCQGLDQLTAARPLRTSYSRLQEAAGRLGWTVVAIYRDEGISGTKGRDKRPGLDALLKDGPFETASDKRTFLREPQISSDYVLKPAMQRPRTQS